MKSSNESTSGTVRATWNGVVIAESSETILVEGNHYFPAESIRPGVLEPSRRRSRCFWKGEASYFHVVAEGKRRTNAAWKYAEPSLAAERVRDRIAFWRGVQITE